MAGVAEHYDNLLADHYSWIYGGFDQQLENNTNFFKKHDIVPRQNGTAIDLGAGSGFQSIPLAQLGFQVTAIDLSAKLLDELKENCRGLNINIVKDDFLNFPTHLMGKAELAVCMGDTLPHLDSKDTVTELFNKVFMQLEEGGVFVLTFRDLVFELSELDRFIPVRSDEKQIFTCFLEYEPEYVKVHDLVYEKSGSGWNLKKSFYRKCRIGYQWCMDQLVNSGFNIKYSNIERGMITIIAGK